MRVLFLQQQPCVRSLKYAVGLRAVRPDLEIAFAYQGKTLGEWYRSGDELFDAWFQLGEDPRSTLPTVLREYAPDLVHSHNLPDSLTVLANEVDRAPVVHDVHDLQSLRRTPYENGFPEPRGRRRLERRAIEESAAVVTVSDELLVDILARYRAGGPAVVFPNYALRRDLPECLPPRECLDGRPPRLVYEGTLSTNGGHYDLRAIFRALAAEGVSLAIFPSREAPAYRELAAETPGIRYHDRVDPAALLQRLPEYDLGWAGFNASLNKAHLDTALPNKVFDYLGSCLPVATLDHGAIRRLLRERGVGIALDSPSDLRRALARCDMEGVRDRVAAVRHSLTIEANIDRILALYDAVAAAANRRPTPVSGRATERP
ncbi:MAG: glycosyltransferase [Thermoleophilia bacterium]|nr:glycosyltransferase [Thermoleophilia bacterium]